MRRVFSFNRSVEGFNQTVEAKLQFEFLETTVTECACAMAQQNQRFHVYTPGLGEVSGQLSTFGSLVVFMLIFALQCFFPIFAPEVGGFAGLSILNSESQVREFTITAVSPDGNDVNTGRLALNAGAQRALLLNEVFGGSVGSTAEWLRVDSASALCTSYFAAGNGDTLVGIDPATGGATTIFLPHISVSTGFMELNHTETLIAIVNPGTSVAAVTGQLFGVDGVLRGSISIPVPARGSRSLRASEAFGNFMPNNGVGGKTFDGYVRLISDVPVAAWQRIDTPLSRSVMRGRSSDEIRSTSIAMIPHFVFGGSYGAFINLINPTTGQLNLQLAAVDDRGNNIGEVIQISLPPGAGRRSPVGEFFRVLLPAIFPPPLITGHIRIQSQSGTAFQIVGDVEIFSTTLGARGSALLFPISDAAATSWTIPFATSTGEYFTGYAIANPNELLTVQTDVQVEAIRSDGTIADRRTISLSPRSRHASVIPSGIAGGYLRFTSVLPFTVLGSIGTRDGRALDQLPALR
jgi:hypothetical protein